MPKEAIQKKQMVDRERLERSIAGLEAARTSLDDDVVEPALSLLREELSNLLASKSQKERRQVTILFGDVVGFTGLSERMDAERVNDWMNALWSVVDGAILRHGGRIDKHIGDAVMAVFGSPSAREDDPQRAVEAALAIQQSIREFNLSDSKQSPLLMRIGINTGAVVLGRISTTGEHTAIGDAVNLASRIENAAPIGGILISQNTYRHIQGKFRVSEGENMEVKGRSQRIQTYRVKGKRPRRFQLDLRGIEGVYTRLVGRGRELALLKRNFEKVVSPGSFQLVVICGEAGIGKSRLLNEFLHWMDLQEAPVRLFKGRSSLQRQLSPAALVRDLFVFRFGISENDPRLEAQQKLVDGIKSFMGEECLEEAHLIGQLLGYDFSDSPYLKGLLDDPEKIHDQALHYVKRFFTVAAEEMPVVILLEDLHWADNLSLSFIRHLFSEGRDIPLLLVCTTRPTLYERFPDALGESMEDKEERGSRNQRIDLQTLSKADSRQLVEEIMCRASVIPERLYDIAVNGSEGNPFYLEELIKMLVDGKAIVRTEREWWVDEARLSDIKIPSTLVGVLQARLDGLESRLRVILQRAAVIGRVFWDGALVVLGQGGRSVSTDLHNIHRDLETLRDREFVFVRRESAFEGHREYVFKHALLRDVALDTVLLDTRKNYHSLSAAWLTEASGENVEKYAGIIGEHWESADQKLEAAHWFLRAGEFARRSYVVEIAAELFDRVLKLLPNDGEDSRGKSAMGLRMRSLKGLGDVLLPRAQYQDAIAAFEALLELGEAGGNSAAQAEALIGLADVQEALGDYRAAQLSAEKAERIASSSGTGLEGLRALAVYRIGRAAFRLGKAEYGLETAERALALSRQLNDESMMARSQGLLGLLLFMTGQYAESTRHYERALELERSLGDQVGVASRLNNLAVTAHELGDYKKSIAITSEAYEIALKTGDRNRELLFLSNIGDCLVQLGRFTEAEGKLRQVIEKVGASRPFFLPDTYISFAVACLEQQKLEAAYGYGPPLPYATS